MSTDLLHSLLESFNNPQMKHAAMVHLPVAISLLGVLGLLVLALTGGRSGTLRWVCVVVYLLGVGSAMMTVESGEEAEHSLDVQVMTEAALEDLEHHEEMAEKLWLFFAVTAGLTVATAIGKDKKLLRAAAMGCALLSGVSAAGYTAVVGHYGGSLVYKHGVGVPASVNNLRADPATPATPTPPKHD